MKSKFTTREVLFQIALNAIVFLFYAYDRRGDSFMNFHFAFFANYAIAALVINYLALPYFYSKRNVWTLIAIVMATLIVSVLIEELFLEQIYFPQRGASFKAWLAFMDLIPIITIISGGKFAWDAITSQRQVEILKDAVRQSELQFLRSQINPHFLFNNLNNLYSYALEGSEKTPEIILELSGLLRYMLYECQDELVALSKEIQQLESYVNLNKLQIEARGEVKFTKDGNFQEYQIAPLILIVFIENAFKHSFASLSEGIAININVKVDENGLLKLYCKNKFHEQTNNDQVARGIGLENVKKRLDLIYPQNHELKINIEDDEYIVLLTIELQKGKLY
ncbi:sensor histidine kinase [Portibacter marinus]|uniref:sensor histidine kinase n=1 Tax=Portibacter marinus TaxID=2898660 RepID=UPI001F170592|nr:histidine kinase [Portibacter marinus]